MDISAKDIIGANIADLRRQAGHKQSELSAKIGIPLSTLAHHEQGRTQPDVEALLSYADFFGVSLDYLFGRNKFKHDYKKLGETFSNSITLGEIMNDICRLPLKEKTYLARTVEYISKRKPLK